MADIFSGPQPIEIHARNALRNATVDIELCGTGTPLPQNILDVMTSPDAHDVCRLITQLPFNWAPPQTSSDPLYTEHSEAKVHVELLGPGGLVKSDAVRLGLYGMQPHAEYGVRTHPAEETFIMLAGQAFWKRGTAPYMLAVPGERSHHPSMLPHASMTKEHAFLSVFAWHGDISTTNYVYEGLPDGP